MTKLYMLMEYANFGEDGLTMHIMGLYTTSDLAVAEVQHEHNEHHLTTWGLHDYRLYELEVDKPDSKYTYDDYKTFGFSDKTERTVCLDDD